MWFVLLPSKKRQGVFFPFKKGNGNSQGLIRLSNNLYRRQCTKTKQIMSVSLDSIIYILNFCKMSILIKHPYLEMLGKYSTISNRRLGRHLQPM